MLYNILYALACVCAAEGYVAPARPGGYWGRNSLHMSQRESSDVGRAVGVLATSLGLLMGPAIPAYAGLKGSASSYQEILAKEQAVKDADAAAKSEAATSSSAGAKKAAKSTKAATATVTVKTPDVPATTSAAAPVKVPKYAKKPKVNPPPTIPTKTDKSTPPKFKFAEEGAVYYAEQTQSDLKAKKALLSKELKGLQSALSKQTKDVGRLTTELSRARSKLDKTNDASVKALYQTEVREKDAELTAAKTELTRLNANVRRDVTETESIRVQEKKTSEFITKKKAEVHKKKTDLATREKADKDRAVAKAKEAADKKRADSIRTAQRKVDAAKDVENRAASTLKLREKAYGPAVKKVSATEAKLKQVSRAAEVEAKKLKKAQEDEASTRALLSSAKESEAKIGSELAESKAALRKASKMLSDAQTALKSTKK